MGYYSANPHYEPADFSEERERLEAAEAQAGRWFNSATTAQLARFNDRMAVAAAYKGSPRWDRERDAAHREFSETTAAASALYEETVRELVLNGEVSEELAYRWDESNVAGAMLEAAE